jgi:hypothetical protein
MPRSILRQHPKKLDYRLENGGTRNKAATKSTISARSGHSHDVDFDPRAESTPTALQVRCHLDSGHEIRTSNVMEHPGRNLTDPEFGRVTDFYSVGCRFESCWDRHPVFSTNDRNIE